MARLVVFQAYGGPDVLETVAMTDPHAATGQVRVRVRAAGVQPFDTRVRSGAFKGHVQVQFPQSLGNEFAGVVDEVGANSLPFGVGDEVIGFTTMNAYSEFVIVSPDNLVLKPAGMPWIEAGALSACGQTAHNALTALRVGKGDTILIHAAAGGVGTMAVQLARVFGATVIGTASDRNHDYLRDLGATPVTYGAALPTRVRAQAPQGVDAALDAAGRDAIPASVELVHDKSRIGTIVDYAGASEYRVRMLRGARTSALLAELARLYSDGKIRIHIQQAYPFSAAAQAHSTVEDGHVRGKVVLVPD